MIHRDLKPDNILLRENGEPAIIDFGYCERISGRRPLLAYNVGSPSYMAPEAYQKNRYSEKSDVWALGAIYFEMVSGNRLDSGCDIKYFFNFMEQEGRL